MQRGWLNIKKRWLSLLLGVVFSVIFISFVYSLQHDPNLSQALVAFGTLILALVTSLTILNSREQEKRDRKERLLNEIIQWAEGILLFGVGETVRENWAAYSDEQKTTKQSAMRKGFGFMDILDKGVKIRYASSNIDATLESHVYSTMKLLQAHIDLWTQVKDNKITDWPQIVAQDKSRLDDSARELIKKATALIFVG